MIHSMISMFLVSYHDNWTLETPIFYCHDMTLVSQAHHFVHKHPNVLALVQISLESSDLHFWMSHKNAKFGFGS